MYRNVLFLNYAQIAINTNVSETKQVGGYLSFCLPPLHINTAYILNVKRAAATFLIEVSIIR